jgi:hypothetical protein
VARASAVSDAAAGESMVVHRDGGRHQAAGPQRAKKETRGRVKVAVSKQPGDIEETGRERRGGLRE